MSEGIHHQGRSTRPIAISMRRRGQAEIIAETEGALAQEEAMRMILGRVGRAIGGREWSLWTKMAEGRESTEDDDLHMKLVQLVQSVTCPG